MWLFEIPFRCSFHTHAFATGRQGLHPRRHAAAGKQAETLAGRPRCAQGLPDTGILQRVVRFRVFTAAQDSWRQIDGDESFFMRNELRRFETCAIFLQQVLKMLFFWLKRQVRYWVIFQADWFMWMFSKSSQYLHNQWEGRGL